MYRDNMTDKRIASIIMAGGKGTRMSIPDKHKATFEVAGVPAITRLLDALAETGITFNVIVVGAFAEQLMGVVAQTKYTPLYTFQPVQKGTGNAAKIGIHALQQPGFDGDVVIVPGDAVIHPSILQTLVATYQASQCDMAILVMDKEYAPDFGHIIQDGEGKVLGSIEYWDIMKANLTKRMKSMLSVEEDASGIITRVKELLESNLKEEKRIAKVFPSIYQAIKDFEAASAYGEDDDSAKSTLEMIGEAVRNSPEDFVIKGQHYDAEDLLQNTKYVNVSIYLASAETWYEYIEHITSNNAQNEEYLTDIMQILVDAGKEIVVVPLASPDDVMAFNTPEELETINEHFQQ